MSTPAPPGSLDWISRGTAFGVTIDAAIPLVYEAYAVLDTPLDGYHGAAVEEPIEAGIVDLLTDSAGGAPVVAGYLCWGSHQEHLRIPAACDHVTYAQWSYTVVETDVPEALAVRIGDGFRGPLPDLLFPEGRSWLVSHLWDDSWVHFGGTEAFIARLEAVGGEHVRRVRPGEVATPPGRTAI